MKELSLFFKKLSKQTAFIPASTLTIFQRLVKKSNFLNLAANRSLLSDFPGLIFLLIYTKFGYLTVFVSVPIML